MRRSYRHRLIRLFKTRHISFTDNIYKRKPGASYHYIYKFKLYVEFKDYDKIKDSKLIKRSYREFFKDKGIDVS